MSGSEAVDIESLAIAVVSSLVVKGKQNVLWSDEAEQFPSVGCS